jgi:hypothetical protein
MPETYEFNSEENKQFRGVVVLMRLMSAVTYLSGGLYLTLLTLHIPRFDNYLAEGLGFTFALILGTAILMTVSALLYSSSTKFQLVIDTEGNDIEHLMNGLEKLNSVFRWGSRGLWLIAVSTGFAITYLIMSAKGF